MTFLKPTCAPKNSKRKNQRGFTLLELLIVIGVIAILATITVPSYIGVLKDADLRTAAADLKKLRSALESYYLHHEHQYPTFLSALLTETPRRIDDIPVDPFKRGDYYHYSNFDDHYLVWTNGPNKEQDISVDLDNKKILVSKTSDDIYETNLRAEKQ